MIFLTFSKIFISKVRLKRNPVNQLMTTYIPSLFILAIAQITVYFKNEHFKTSVPVAVTSLLGNYLFWMKYCED